MYKGAFEDILVNSKDFKGGSPWGGISSDNKNGILFLTTGNASPYFVGII